MQGEDWSPFVVTDSKMITGQNPQVTSPHTAGNWHPRPQWVQHCPTVTCHE